MGPVRVLRRKSTCLCPSLRRTSQALGWSFLPEQMWIQIYTRALFLPRTPPVAPQLGTTISEEEKEELSNLPRPRPGCAGPQPLHLSLEISQRRQPAPRPPRKAQPTCSCPAGEPPRLGLPPRQGPNASLGVRAPLSPARICLSVFIPHCNASGALT